MLVKNHSLSSIVHLSVFLIVVTNLMGVFLFENLKTFLTVIFFKENYLKSDIPLHYSSCINITITLHYLSLTLFVINSLMSPEKDQYVN